jgi:hypothetical protein
VWLNYVYFDGSLLESLTSEHHYTRSGAHSYKDRGRPRQLISSEPCVEVDEFSPTFATYRQPGNPYTGEGPFQCERCGNIEPEQAAAHFSWMWQATTAGA